MDKRKKIEPEEEIVLQASIREESRGVHKNLFLIIFGLTGLLILSFVMNIILFSQEANDRYFTVDENLSIVEVVPTDVPLIKNSSLVNWTTEVVSETYSLGYHDWRDVLTEQRQHFDLEAFNSFTNSLKSSGNLKYIIDKRLNSIVNLDGPAVVSASGVSMDTGRFTWVVEVPIVINFETSNGVEATQRLKVKATIHRVDTREHSRGIRIKSIRAV